jgi:hypothetical protein
MLRSATEGITTLVGCAVVVAEVAFAVLGAEAIVSRVASSITSKDTAFEVVSAFIIERVRVMVESNCCCCCASVQSQGPALAVASIMEHRRTIQLLKMLASGVLRGQGSESEFGVIRQHHILLREREA